MAANTGLRYALNKNVEFHGILGRSLRSGNLGGPQVLGYVGVKLAFASLPPDK